jgi:hypothetical protein
MCGKTEMSLELSQDLEIPYFKNEGEWKFFEDDPQYFANCVKYGATFFLSYLKTSGTSVIMDRGHPSEWVYSKAFNRKTDLDILRQVDESFAELGTKIIIPTRTSYEHVIDQFSAITPAKLSLIDSLYHEFSKWTACETFFMNVDDENLQREMLEIKSFLKGSGILE